MPTPFTPASRTPPIPGSQVPFLDARTGLISREWYNWLATRQGVVDLSGQVSGTLEVENGGTGLNSGTAGGVLYFSDANTIGTLALDQNEIVLGGGSGAPTTPVGLGTANTVLHGNAAGAPSFSAVSLTSDVAGTLPVANGGTGVTTSTGTGATVRGTGPTLFAPELVEPELVGSINSTLVIGTGSQWQNNDVNEVSVTGSATTLVNEAAALFYVVHDMTSGGFAVGVMDQTVGAITIVNTIVGVSFYNLASVLKAQVTSGANPRSLSVFCINLGVTA